MIRLFINAPLREKEKIELNEKQTHYLKDVMRLKEEENCLVFNGIDGEWMAKVGIKTKKIFSLEPLELIKKQLNATPLYLFMASIKKENMDLVIQKATELGVTDFFPVFTERTVVRKVNQERFKTIAVEASEQCERLDVPTIHPPISLKEILNFIPKKGQLIYLLEREEGEKTKMLSPEIPCFLVGPEGGFTTNERDFLKQIKNGQKMSLGNQILRAETACIACLACWRFRAF